MFNFSGVALLYCNSLLSGLTSRSVTAQQWYAVQVSDTTMLSSDHMLTTK